MSTEALRARTERAPARTDPESGQIASEVAFDLGPAAVAGVGGDAGASMLASLMPSLAELDRDSVVQFYRLLSHHLAFDGALTCRPTEARLGLVVTLVSRGELPPVSRYEEARGAEDQLGREWPSASTLSLAYGGYPRAVEAAARYLSPGRTQPHSGRRSRARGKYSREEILASVRGCRTALVSADDPDPDWWPDAQAFFLWNRVGRELARKTGRPDPRLPDREALRRWFASYEEAVEACRREERLRLLGAPKPGARPRPRRPRSGRIRV